MTQDQFTKIFLLVQEVKSDMATKQDVTELKEDLNQIRNILDKHTGMLDTDEIERLALSAQVDRLQDWAERSGAKTGVRIGQAS